MDRVVGGIGWWVGGSWRLVRMGLGGGEGRGGKEVGAVTKGVKAVGKSAVREVAQGTASVIAAGKAIASTASSGIAEATSAVTTDEGEAVPGLKGTFKGKASLLETVPPPTPQSSAVLIEPGPEADNAPRKRDEL